MKVLLVLVLLVGLTQAGFLDEIKNAFKAIGYGFKQTSQAFIPYAANVTKDLLKQAEHGALTAVSKTIMDLLFKNIGKRDDHGVVDSGKHLLSELGNLLHLGTQQFTDVIEKTFSKIGALHSELLSFAKHPQQVLHEVENLIAKHTSLSTEFLQALERDVNHIVSLFHHTKRSMSTQLTSIATCVVNMFKPVLDGILKIVNQAGQLIKNTAAHFLNAAHQSVAQLGQSFHGDLAKLLQHGTEALNAVKHVAENMLTPN